MKGITYTQVAQYCVLIFAFLVPAIFISLLVTGIPVPQLAFGAPVSEDFAARAGAPGGSFLLDVLDDLHRELGFTTYTGGTKATIDVFAITLALMVGTAGLPHVIVRFFTVPKVKDARLSVGYALVFIALLYTTAPAIAAFARTNMILSTNNVEYAQAPEWLKSWENSGLIAWQDKNNDGTIQYAPGKAFVGKPKFVEEDDSSAGDAARSVRGTHGERLIQNEPNPDSANELYVDRDIMVLANPEIAQLPAWVVGLVAAGGLAAALSTAAGLLLTISTGVAHDLLKRTLMPQISEKRELLSARIAATFAVLVAGYFGIYPPGFVAQVVAFAFGLAASSIFPMIFLGIFFQRMNQAGALSGMIAGMGCTTAYIVYFKFVSPELNTPEHWLFGISPEGIGAIGMLVNFAVAAIVCRVTPPPSEKIQGLVRALREP